MSYRNDPYDPKQAALLDPVALEAAVGEARKPSTRPATWKPRRAETGAPR